MSPREPIPKPARFIWPPQPLDASPAPRTPQHRPSAKSTRRPPTLGVIDPRSLWEHVEETWLGVLSPAWPRRCRETTWQPEPIGLWCQRCGRSVGDFEADAGGCASCRETKVPWDAVIRLGPYEGLLRDAILEIKHAGFRRLATDVGRELGDQVALALGPQDPDAVLLVPIPMALRRRAQRPLDHTHALARGMQAALAEQWGRPSPITQPLFRQFTPTQQAKSFDLRRKNIRGTMRPKPWQSRSELAGKTLILIDDVLTSGATLEEACRALRVGLNRSTKGTVREESPQFSVLAAVVAVAGERG
jgi:predicted amidophosphoribosyltransferase